MPQCFERASQAADPVRRCFDNGMRAVIVIMGTAAERFDVGVERFVIARVFVMSGHETHLQGIQADDALNPECDLALVSALDDDPAAVGFEQRGVVQLDSGRTRERRIGVGVRRRHREQGVAAAEPFDDPLRADPGGVIAAIEIRQRDRPIERVDDGERLRIRRVMMRGRQIDLSIVADECNVRERRHREDERADERQPEGALPPSGCRPAPAEQTQRACVDDDYRDHPTAEPCDLAHGPGPLAASEAQGRNPAAERRQAEEKADVREIHDPGRERGQPGVERHRDGVIGEHAGQVNPEHFGHP